MQARHVMSSPVTTVDKSTSVDECLQLVGKSGFTVLPVVDERKHLVGIVSEGDLLRARFRELGGVDPVATQDEVTAGDVMSSPVVAMTADAEVSELASAMLRSRLRGIPIVHDHDILGIVTRPDLIAILTTDDAQIAKEVQHRLDVYGGAGRWRVDVAHGSATIFGATPQDPERNVIAALADTVPGITEVHFPPE
ncbi:MULTISPECIES: CBS domain-containing protein [unclassified Rhodococcus (in: high G+C Gram-positive bacteria)]|uniref:CBS domain-containing protein n=1 Tax=unclassified Rhodococcus (in: high G+C Gram-positive bacteria) TaxID=192944 RepID=UPI0002DC583B|nr:CBS domain-containing protein [Rhodococcus sp. DK17]